MKLQKPIALIGMMGAGKTSFGKRIAKKIDAQFFDSDAEIKARTGYSPKEIFNYFGNDTLKEIEMIVIKDLCEHSYAIIATGDGLIDNKKAWEFLKDNAITIWLNIDLKLISARLRPNDDRPYLDEKLQESMLKFVTKLYQRRAQRYKQAHLTIHKPILQRKMFLKKLEQSIQKMQENEILPIKDDNGKTEHWLAQKLNQASNRENKMHPQKTEHTKIFRRPFKKKSNINAPTKPQNKKLLNNYPTVEKSHAIVTNKKTQF